MRANLDCLWETDTLRPSKPSVLEEVDRSLFVIDSLWQVVPVCGTAPRAAERGPDNTPTLPVFVRFGSWIGGDRRQSVCHATNHAWKRYRSYDERH